MHRDRQTDYVNSGNFDTVVENKIGAGINFPEATRILFTCYIKSRKCSEVIYRYMEYKDDGFRFKLEW